jgi:mannose-6-phosphate isomerase
VVSPTSSDKFVNWCRHTLLPFWAKNAFDSTKGGFFEQFHFDGSPDRNTHRRVRVASRQIYSFSHAKQLGWTDQTNLILNGVDWLMDKAWCRDGNPGFVHLVDDTGNPVDTKRDLYDHAFHILGLSWAFQATRDRQILGLARECFAFVEEALASKSGGWLEDDIGTSRRRQNPHMHMFEALMALFQASGDHAFLARADEILSLLEKSFISKQSGALLEFFDENWKPEFPAIVEPGHMAEWFWLTHQRRQLDLPSEIPTGLKNFLQMAEEFGRQESGFLIDACQEDRQPKVSACRLWGQTEWLKALLADFEANETANDDICSLIDRIIDQYLTTDVPGLWIDQISLQGAPLSQRVPASIIYHLVSAAAEVERVLISPKQEKTHD